MAISVNWRDSVHRYDGKTIADFKDKPSLRLEPGHVH